MPSKWFTLNTIPVFIYKKNIMNYISPILSFLFNRSIAEGLFTDILKVAGVTPIFKSKSNLSFIVHFKNSRENNEISCIKFPRK